MPVNGVFYSQTKGLVISTNSLNRVFVQTGGTTTFTGITSGNTIVEVQGVSGQVMRVTDCANGVLFSSNNVSGQAILQTNSCGSIIGGIGSSSTANATTIGGGCSNSTTVNFATIGGGCLNTSCNSYSTVGGGRCNSAAGIDSTIGGGISNVANGSYSSTIGGGQSNTSSGSHATIGGGACNTSSGTHSTVGGGYTNTANCTRSTVGGGQSNLSSGYGSTVGGGQSNTASGYRSTVGGGQSNTSSGPCSTIGGGKSNITAANYSTISGGRDNCVCSGSDNTTIGGGRGNYIDSNSNIYSTIGGGFANTICNVSQCSTIIGGRSNVITGSYRSSILGGYNNNTSGYDDVFIIGCCITATVSNYSFMNNLCIIGNLVKATGTFKIPHPDPKKTESHYLSHSFVESPTAGDNIYRYEVESIDGVAEITLPDYFSYLNENIQVWVSGKNNFGNGYGEVSVDLKKIEIHTSIDGLYNVLVIGTRKDDHAKKYWKGTEEEK
jgi:hypothetical protein